MSGIQILLLTGVILLFLYYLLRVRSAFLDLLALTALSVTAIFFILFPETTNKIAHSLGVGRGADMIFYICILLFLFVILKLFARIRRLEEDLTKLVREQAKTKAVTKELND